MAAPTYETDLLDVVTDPPSTTGWTIIGTGAMSAPERDYFIQSANVLYGCISKVAWTNAIKGMIYNFGGGLSHGTDGVFIYWVYYAATNSLAEQSAGGIQLLVGSSATDYKCWYVGGKDTLKFDVWRPYVCNTSITADLTVNSPTATQQYFGARANLPTTQGPSKGNPLGIDAIRYGRGLFRYLNGESGNYATFLGAMNYSTDLARQWGLLDFAQGVYYMQGFHSFGTASVPVNFVDENRVMFIRPTPRATEPFNRFEILNSGSTVDWTNISISALGTVSKGTFVVTAGAFTATDCQFVDMNTFTFLSTSVLSSCTFRRCGQIIAPGTNMVGSRVLQYTGAANTSALIWNVNTNPDGKLNNMTFTKGTTAHHAIELGTSSPLAVTLRGITFTGFNTSNNQNDSVIHVKRTNPGETVTISAVGCSGTVSWKSDGAQVEVIVDPVTFSIHVQDVNTGDPIYLARVLVQATAGGPKPFEASVGIERSGNTATVTHNAHGLVTNNSVVIKGAIQKEYNGAFVITKINDNSYSYTVSGTPDTPATGDIKSTFSPINGYTDTGGNISDSITTYTAAQPFSGRIRKATGTPYYKTSPISGSIDSEDGLAVTVQLIPD